MPSDGMGFQHWLKDNPRNGARRLSVSLFSTSEEPYVERPLQIESYLRENDYTGTRFCDVANSATLCDGAIESPGESPQFMENADGAIFLFIDPGLTGQQAHSMQDINRGTIAELLCWSQYYPSKREKTLLLYEADSYRMSGDINDLVQVEGMAEFHNKNGDLDEMKRQALSVCNEWLQ